MDATSTHNHNPNGPNPPTLIDLIIIPDEPTIPIETQPIPSNRKPLKEPSSKIWDYFTTLDGGDPNNSRP